MRTADQIIEEVKTLPEHAAREVLDFIGYLKAKQVREESCRDRARATLATYRGRFKAVKFDRAELYDRR